MGVIELDLQGHLAILTPNSKKWRLTLLLYTADLGRPTGVKRPKRAPVLQDWKNPRVTPIY